MYYGPSLDPEAAAVVLETMRCPRCGEPLTDLRDVGFNPAQVSGCYLWGSHSNVHYTHDHAMGRSE